MGNQGELLAIDSLLEYRWNASYNEFEVKGHWSGFETMEDSWERLSRLYPEIPRMLETWSQDKLDFKSAVLKLKERSKSPIPDVAALAVEGTQLSGAQVRGRKRAATNGRRASKRGRRL